MHGGWCNQEPCLSRCDLRGYVTLNPTIGEQVVN